MPEYISREAANDTINETAYEYEDEKALTALYHAADRLNELPAADVVEVRHGWWIIEDKYTDYRTERCSTCGFVANRSYVQDVWFYCPRCGAKMDGGQDDV